ncbi:acyltransferase [Raoultella planticola]|uniref:acyltransferase n=1 Tax=Raoultella planticola TaxID=575 RepID=UPI00145FCDB3|nr:acyltransferase [Raoultella planticola]
MRNNTLDLFRYVAAFCIVIVHVGYYNDLNENLGDILRESTRWALPFFFLASGFLIKNNSADATITRMKKIFYLFLVANIVFLPIALTNPNIGTYKLIELIFSYHIFNGIYFHLWFLPSILIAFFIIPVLSIDKPTKYFLPLSVVMLIMIWVADLLTYFGYNANYNFFRTIMSVPLVYIGYLLSKTSKIDKINTKTIVIILIASIVLSVLECVGLYTITGIRTSERQLPLFSLITAIFVVLLCKRILVKDNPISKLGRNYSLGIYLYHPIFIIIFSTASKKIHHLNSFTILVFSFLTLTTFLFLADSKFKRLSMFLNGDVKRKN